MKFQWRSKRFIAGVFTIVALGTGLANPQLAATLGTQIACSVVACES